MIAWAPLASDPGAIRPVPGSVPCAARREQAPAAAAASGRAPHP